RSVYFPSIIIAVPYALDYSPDPSFVFNATATSAIYSLSLHDALPISRVGQLPELVDERIELLRGVAHVLVEMLVHERQSHRVAQDRKSTRLNSSHGSISYAVFCLNKKKRC